ncbi:questin oxidase family protein [Rhizohabitans arisaemae]|uniref:questin oxidase family protein n=1 Tax=Rhizohabitans arisaemae TaxID=2720610 RepID=UPI0024B09B88|nr:questin oxidase family protein [Rhizohabitans arisaemae]
MDLLDEALERLHRTGPEFAGGLSNHGPMAVEALVRLGHGGAIPRWVDGYLKQLDELPGTDRRITETDWRQALGELRRVGDWTELFTRLLAEEPWRDVLARWWPRLTPGLAAGATHGVIRTSHAVRAIAETETPQRRTELAHALAYWAAAYQPLPGEPRSSGQLALPEALAALPILTVPPAPGLISTQLGDLDGLPGFPGAVRALRPPGDVPEALAELADAFTRIFLTHGRDAPVRFLHAVTAPVATASALPYLPQSLWRPTYDALWQLGAGLYGAFAGEARVEALPTGAPPAAEELTARAVATGEEHAIKMTEACLRLYARTPDPLHLHAAARAVELLAP